MFRFIIAVDVEAATLSEAYQSLKLRMNANDWETTDEAYDDEGMGDGQIPLEELNAARMAGPEV